MEKQNRKEPLWVISFDTSKKEASWLTQAHYRPNLQITENQRLALNVLERLNESFREVTETYLKEVEGDEKTREQVDEIRKNFESFDKWLLWIRAWLDNMDQD